MTFQDMTDAVASSSWLTALARLFTIIIIPLSTWAMSILLSVKSDVTVLQTTVNLLVQDRYRADEARRDFQLRDLRLDTIEKQTTLRDDAIDARLKTLENEVHKTNTAVEQIAPTVRRRP